MRVSSRLTECLRVPDLHSRMYSSQEDLKQLTDPQKVHVDMAYRGPHVSFPLGPNDISNLIEGFKNKKVSG